VHGAASRRVEQREEISAVHDTAVHDTQGIIVVEARGALKYRLAARYRDGDEPQCPRNWRRRYGPLQGLSPKLEPPKDLS
jgi:hypothetical protein